MSDAERPERAVEPSECRRRAEDLLASDGPDAPLRAAAWAVLALAGEVRDVRRALVRGGR